MDNDANKMPPPQKKNHKIAFSDYEAPKFDGDHSPNSPEFGPNTIEGNCAVKGQSR